MKLFSERYGYIKPSEVFIREAMPNEIENAICTCYDTIKGKLNESRFNEHTDSFYNKMGLFLWTEFLNKRQNDFFSRYNQDDVQALIIKDVHQPWFRKLDSLELSIDFLYQCGERDRFVLMIARSFIQMLNYHFQRLNYAYRVVDRRIVEITSEEEIKAIEKCLNDSQENVRNHLQTSLGLMAKRPDGDFRNSIKESISAVEAFCRENTGTKSLGDALIELNKKGFKIPKMLEESFKKLYAYTNQPESGIRHALMDQDGDYVPSYSEAAFMLISCSAFLNYLYSKRSN